MRTADERFAVRTPPGTRMERQILLGRGRKSHKTHSVR